MSKVKTIQIPASTTNLGSGFDALGLALKLYLRVEVEDSAGEARKSSWKGKVPAICRLIRKTLS